MAPQLEADKKVVMRLRLHFHYIPIHWTIQLLQRLNFVWSLVVAAEPPVFHHSSLCIVAQVQSPTRQLTLAKGTTAVGMDCSQDALIWKLGPIAAYRAEGNAPAKALSGKSHGRSIPQTRLLHLWRLLQIFGFKTSRKNTAKPDRSN
jgi:hypothetical protein